VFQIIVGAILVVVGYIIGYVFFWTGIGPYIGAALVSMGVSMIVGGIVQMLMPAPKSPYDRDRPDANSSYIFNGPVNTHAQGNPVPVLYGRMTVGSAVISAGIYTNQEMIGGTGGPGSFPRDGGGGIIDGVVFQLQ
jgi:predicted phage tail protein